jgi:hypothetical protein
MAGIPVIRSGPVASISAQSFDSATTPVDDSLSLAGSEKNGLAGAGASFLVFSTGFTSNADQFTSAGSIIAGNVLSVAMSDDTDKGPFHCSAISQVVGPLGAAVSAVSLYFEDGTNGGYRDFRAGADYPGGYLQCIGCPSDTVDNGAALSVTATLTHAGLYMLATVGGESMFESFATAISWCGREIQVDGGIVTAGSEIDFNSISLRDRLTTRSTTAPITGQFYGHVTAEAGIISLRGPIQLGDDGSTNNTYFLDTNTFCLWADNPVNTKFYRIDITKNGASSTTTVIWGDSTTPAPVTIDVAGTVLRWVLFTAGTTAQEPTEFSVYGCTLKRGRAWELGSTSTLDGGVLQDITDITMDVDAEILNMQMIDVKLIYGLPPVTGQLTGSIFNSPSTFCMTISTQTANMTVDYEFDSTCRGAGEAIEFTHASGNILITASAGYYQLVAAYVTVTGSGTVSFPAGTPVTTEVKTVDSAGANVASVRVIVEATGASTLPVADVVTITRAGSTATVAHTAHGMETGDKIAIRNAVEIEYKGIQTITVVNANSYTYTVSGTPTTPATGTITSTFIALEGLTDVNGNISTSRVYASDEPITGSARKSTAIPFFKAAAIPGVILSASGYSQTVTMISDE